MNNRQFTVGRYYVEIEQQDPYNNDWYSIQVSAPEGSFLTSGYVNRADNAADTFILDYVKINSDDNRINDGLEILLEVSESVSSRRGAQRFVIAYDRDNANYISAVAANNNYKETTSGNYATNHLRELYGASLGSLVPEDKSWE